MTLEALYARISAATCTEHGLGSDADREAHIRAIVAHLLELRNRAA